MPVAFVVVAIVGMFMAESCKGAGAGRPNSCEES